MISDDQLSLWGQHVIDKLTDEEAGEQERNFYFFLKGLYERTGKNNDAVVSVNGPRNKGKTSLAINAALALKRMGLSFSLDNIFHGIEDLEDAVTKVTSSTKGVYIFDEMIDYAFSRNSMGYVNKAINQIFTKNRKLNNVCFFCIPYFRSLDVGIRNNIVNLWVQVFYKTNNVERNKNWAMAALFKKDENPLNADPWSLELDDKYKSRPLLTAKDLARFFKKRKSFISFMRFPILPEVIENEYGELSKMSIKKSGQDILNHIAFKKKETEVV